MARVVHEPINLAPRGKRQYSRIPWDKFANGQVWELTRQEDWPHVRTAGQAMEMAQRYADREGFELEGSKDENTIWVKFTRKPAEHAHAPHGPVPAANPFVEV